MEKTVWAAQLSISTRTARKIAQDHGIAEAEVRDAVQCVENVPVRWDGHPKRGLRAVLSVIVRGRPCAVVLYPVKHPMGDAWRLGSAYFVD